MSGQKASWDRLEGPNKGHVHGALQLLAVSQWNKSSEMQLIFTITEFQRTLMQQVCLLQSRKLLACL